MTPTKRLNFFDLLEINPADSLSEADLDALLARKGAEWTKKARNPKVGVQFTGYRQLIPDIRKVMLDPAQRRAEADAYHVLMKAKKEAAIQQLEISAGLDAAKGYITPEQVNQLVTGSGGFLTQPEVRQELKRMSIPVRTDSARATPTTPTVTPTARSTMQEIRISLNDLGLKQGATLYDFLELADSTDTRTLHQKATEIYKFTQDAPVKTMEITARSKLSGHGMNIFKNEATREQYTAALEHQFYEDLLNEQVTRLLSGTEKRITAAQYQLLLEMAVSAGLDVERASAYILKRSQQMGGVVEIAGEDAVKSQLRCPSCHRLNPAEAQYCSECNSRLQMPCPACKTIIVTNSRACIQCGFPVGNMVNVKRMLDDAQSRIVQQDVATARKLLLSASQQWTSPKGKKLNDPLTTELAQRLKEVESEFSRRQDIQTQLTTTIHERRFYAARDVLAKLPPDEYLTERARVDIAIDKAEHEVTAARRSNLSGEDSVDLYRAILMECKDCQMALDALAQTPPSPPADLVATRSDKVVSLQWQPSPSKDVRYTIVRKYQARPISPNDGEQVATVSGTLYEDATPAPGLPAYYAVYANREGILSNDATLAAEPVMLAPGIEKVVAEISDGEIRLSWTPPPNVIEVIVRRLVGKPPQSHHEGEDVPVIHNSQVVDRGLQNDTCYYYTLMALYQRHDGKKQGSKAYIVSASPTQPPIPPEISVEAIEESSPSGKQLQISWHPPTKGEVVILRHNAPFAFKLGDIVPKAQLSGVDDVLTGDQWNQAKTPLREMEAVYLLPVVLFQEMAYIGKPLQYVNLDDVRGLQWQLHRKEIHLRWQWPPNCQQAVVAYAHDAYPEAGDSHRHVATLEVTKAEYDLRGYIPVSTESQQDYYLVVRAVTNVDGQRMMASGHEAGARARVSLGSSLTVQYEVVAVRSAGRFSVRRKSSQSPILIIHVTGKGMLPEMLVIRKRQIIPIHKTDGEAIMRIASCNLEEETSMLEVELDTAPTPGAVIKLFLADDAFYDTQGGYVRIQDPPIDKLKLTR